MPERVAGLRHADLTRVLDRYRAPTHRGDLERATHAFTADNPTCGDRVSMRFDVQGQRIVAARFDAQACALTTAAASVVAEALEGRSLAEAKAFDADALDALLPQPFGPERRNCQILPLVAAQRALFGESPLARNLRRPPQAGAGT